ncbi:MAG TPA: LamG domain-containing protein [Trichocoleus sp.]|jgi:hypothetical protein
MSQAFPDPVTIQGPLWSAKAQLLNLASPQQDRILRMLFLEHMGTTVNPPTYRPGTVIALCYIQQVTIQPKKESGESYIWRQTGTPPVGPNTNEWIREQLRTGKLSLLLLLPQYQLSSKPTQFTCLNGEIFLDTLQSESDGRNNLFIRLQIQAVANTDQVQSYLDSRNRNTRTAGERLDREIAVHSSGLSIYGKVTLPWNAQENQENIAQASGVAITAPFQLTQQFSRRANEITFGDFQLTLERERFTLTEEQQWITLWQALIQQLNPRHPVYGRKQTEGATAETAYPNWVTLEFPNPNRVPRLLWRISQWGKPPLLNLPADELNIILSDSALYNPEKPPTSLARIVPSEVILRVNNRQIVLEVCTKEVKVRSEDPQIIYQFNAGNRVQESLSAANLKTTFSPVETPQFLRQTQNLPTPEWSSGNAAQPVQPSVVWGFMPLENGWAQLPVPNLTEQIYLDSELDVNSTDPSKDGNSNPPVALVQGALSLGNDRHAVLKRYAREQPWSLTITDTAALKGTWTLAPNLELTEISLVLDDPSVTLNGFFWLSTGQPRLQDALPDLDNWVSGLRSIPLETVSSKDLFPSALFLEWKEITIQVREDAEKLPSAALSPWGFSYTIDPSNLKKLTDKKVLPENIFGKLSSTLPLIWQRHPHLPMIQALPLTQNQLPANYPSASRQLVPYELDAISEQSLKPQEWRFAVTNARGAEAWPQCVGKTVPASGWQKTFDLPLVSLSVPGLVLESSAEASNNGSGSDLRLQYRFDLPYTDEVNALAQLPKDPVQPDQVSPLPDSIPPKPLQPLTRETFAGHWQKLSTLSSLSMADAVTAFEAPLPAEYDLNLLSLNNVEELPTGRKSLVIAAKIHGSYHVRIFDATGNIVINKGSSEFSPDASLVEELDAALNSQSIDKQTKGELIRKVISNLGYTLKEANVIQNLIEPLPWPVQIEFDLTTYPGAIALQGGFNATLTEQSALKGISGDFYVKEQKYLTGEPQPGQTAYQITAGSLAAYLEAGEMRDQRGLLRSATRFGNKLLQTRVRFQRQPNGFETYDLTTTCQPQELKVANATWKIWFRDLPLKVESMTSFNRVKVQSSVAKDVNDPQARSREYDFLAGYEWRLAEENSDLPYLLLLGLHFYPLTLDQLETSAGKINRIVMTGRLQLPLPDPKELEDFSNAVQVTFQDNGTALKLDAIALLGLDKGLGEWPLALDQNELTDAPLLTWEAIRLSDTKDQLIVEGLQLRFFLFEQQWIVADKKAENPGAQPKYETLIRWTNEDHTPQLIFSTSSTVLKGVYAFASQGNALSPKILTIELNLAQEKHSVDVKLDVQLGKKQLSSLSRSSEPRTAFSATVNFPVLQKEKAVNSAAEWISGQLVDDLILKSNNSQNPIKGLEQNTLHINGQSLQFQWSAYQLKNSTEALQLLPGMELQRDGSLTAPGFAALTFAAIAQANSGIPQLQLKTAFVEALLFCRWGQSLQQDISAPTLDQVFGSSAGDLACGYTVQWQSQSWNETLLLNGVLEIKNLISWPQQLVLRTEGSQTLATLPARQSKNAQPQPLAHLRHTLRILFNQHRIPDDLLEVGEDNLLFQLKSNDPKNIWQFEAVVEHQLVNVSGLSPDTLTLNHDRRWTTVQEVRWLSPQRFKAALSSLQKDTKPILKGAAAGGYLNQRLSKLLTEGNPALLDQLENTLLVESSAYHWINQTALQDKSATTLQFLPNGSQLGILSSPDDYRPSDPNDPQWLLLTLPFLGRLQAQVSDRLDLLQPHTETSEGMGTATSTGSDSLSAHPLQVDPILYLAAKLPNPSWALMFASWGDESPVELASSALDSALGSTWPRLDPSSLEESWFRLQHPLLEPEPEGLQSVIATRPDNPSRLSRSLTLKQLIRGERTSYPPSSSTDDNNTESNEKVDSLFWQPDHLLVTPNLGLPNSLRGTPGLQVLYSFREGEGNIIQDVSGVGERLDLTIKDPSRVEWVTGGGLRINRPTQIRADRPALKIINACRSTNELTIEVWIRLKPDQTEVRKLVPIVTLSEDPNNRYFTLAQGTNDNQDWSSGNKFLIRLRIDGETASNGALARGGFAPITTNPGTAKAELSHLVFTRQKNGEMKFYINGQEQASKTLSGNRLFPVYPRQNTDETFRFGLGNEIVGDSGWSGEYQQVAIYNRALTNSEVSQHYQQTNQAASAPWASSGLQLISSALAGFSQSSYAKELQSISRYVAATLLPSRLHLYNLQPVSLAVSPYLSIEFQPVPNPQIYQLQLVSTELLCLHPVKQSLLPVASFFWENKEQENWQTLESILAWARETHLRLCPNSPIAILRSREIRRLQSDETLNQSQDRIPPLVTTYNYAIVTNLQSTKTLAKRVFRLRSEVTQLRFREGQYSGRKLPNETLYPFELSPPQTIGVQPLHLTDRPHLTQNGNGNVNQDSLRWPWGLSALRVSLQYTEGQQGIVGQVSPSATTLWWQAPQHSVQYRTTQAKQPLGKDATTKELPAAGLPAQFRARAIQSFLPVSLTPPMPTIGLTGLLNWQGKAVERWQPVLPGQLSYLMVGNRPGVMHAIRNQLLRQSQLDSSNDAINTVLVSGSLPVQHRVPRPVPLPPNRDRQEALQPWASYFEPTQNLLVTDTPSAEAFYGETVEGKPAQRLKMCLIEPERGAIFSQWDGTLKFSIRADSETPHQPFTPAEWEITITLSNGEQIVSYNKPSVSDSQVYEVTPAETNTVLFQELLARQTSRSLLMVQAEVMPNGNASNFKQTLTFPLRLLDQTALPLPLKPQFIYFEDPEYNRRLASPSAHASQTVQVPPASVDADPKLVGVKLSADRREYNPDSVLSLRYDWAEPVGNEFKVQLQFRRINANGIATNLSVNPALENVENLPQGYLVQIPLLRFQATDQTPALRPDDVLEVALIISQNTEVKATLNLPLNIVMTPVNPAPEAAYALLRQHSESWVECVRFAWGPTPSQVELVNADDLTTEVVRRRAVFQWTDSVRPNTPIKYAIQKVTQTGSTHFPFIQDK